MNSPVGVSEVVEMIAVGVASRASRLGSTRVICIDGPSGGGKTSLGAAAASRLCCPVVHMDDLYDGWQGLESAWGRLQKNVLEPIRAQTIADYRAFDWERGQYIGDLLRVVPGPYLVVEGCGCARKTADAVACLKLWVDAPAPLRRARVLARDGGQESPQLKRWTRDETEHFARERTVERADLRIWTGPEAPSEAVRESGEWIWYRTNTQ